MSIHNPPQYRYYLYDEWNKKAFNYLKRLGARKQYSKIAGTSNDKNQFLRTLIRTQKALHNWSDMLKDVLRQIEENGVIDTVSLNRKYLPESIGKDVPDWVTYEEDKTVNNFIDELEARKITFQGTDDEITEFVVRFILGQLGIDWEQTVLMIWEMLGKENNLSVNKLNKEMKNFDYLKLFEK